MNDIPRDRYGRPLIQPPGGGKPIPYARASGIGKVLEDDTNLAYWRARVVAIGLANRPDLQALVLGHQDHKDQELRNAVEEAFKAGGGEARRNQGTALHKLSELADWDHLPDELRRDLDAYRACLDQHGLAELESETFVVHDEWKIAGTFDRLLVDGGVVRVADIKGLSLDTPIPTPSGWTTMGEIAVGDEVFDRHGQPCRVVLKSDPKQIGTYRISFDDGATITCDAEHIWITETGYGANAVLTPKSIDEIRATFTKGGQRHHRVPVAGPLQLPDVDLPVDPYLLGCWLGDGAVRGGTITKGRDLFDILESDGHTLGVEQVDKRNGIVTRSVGGLQRALRLAGLLHNKHVPGIYLRAGTEQRLRLLQGLMDTDGTWNKPRRSATFTTTDKRLAIDVEELILSLGQRCNLGTVQATGFGKTVTAYHVNFTPVGMNPFRLPRKADQAAASTKPTNRASRRVMVGCRPGPDVLTACIAVDSPDNTYLCGREMVPTHNTGSSVEYGQGSWACQLAVYANGLRYDPGTGERSPLLADGSDEGYHLDRDTGVIIHLPAGEGRCDLYKIDLRPGVEAIERALWVKDWRNRSKRLLTKIAPPAEGTTATAPAAGGAADEDDGRRDHLVRRYQQLRDQGIDAQVIAAVWPTGVPGPKRAHEWGLTHFGLIGTALNRIEAAHAESFTEPDPRPVVEREVAPDRPASVTIDEGPDMELDDCDAVRAKVDSLPDDQRHAVATIVAACAAAGHSISMKQRPSTRRFTIARALYLMGLCGDLDQPDEERLRAICAHVTGDDACLMPSVSIGEVVGTLDLEHAVALGLLVQAGATYEIDDAGNVRVAVAA